MNNTLTTLTHLINSPPGQLATGGVLAGIVWKFFERVEAVLTDQTKLEIAVWLVGVKVGQKIEPWPETFAKVLDRVFGKKHLSWKCFGTSCLATALASSPAADVHVGLFVRGYGWFRCAKSGSWRTRADLEVCPTTAAAIPDIGKTSGIRLKPVPRAYQARSGAPDTGADIRMAARARNA